MCPIGISATDVQESLTSFFKFLKGEVEMVHLLLIGIDDEHKLYAAGEKSEGRIEVWKPGTLTMRYFGSTPIQLDVGLVGTFKFEPGIAEKFGMMQVVTTPDAAVQKDTPPISLTPKAK